VSVGEFIASIDSCPLSERSALVKPKSITVAVPPSRTLAFAGFESRWMIPARGRLKRLGDLPCGIDASRRLASDLARRETGPGGRKIQVQDPDGTPIGII
jgi:hypothetical protein